MPDFATHARRHDRPRRGHRLRPVHRHPLPRAAARRAHASTRRSRSPSTPPGARSPSPASPWSSRCSACSSWASAFVTGPGHRRRDRWSRSPWSASLTLLPALLGFAGQRVEVTRWRGLIAAGLVAVALVGVGPGDPARSLVGIPAGGGRADRRLRVRPAAAARCRAGRRSRSARPPPTAGAGSCRHHPWTLAIGSAARPAASWPSRCSACGSASPTRATSPRTPTTRQAYDLLSEGFGPGFNGPLLLVAEVPDGTDLAALGAVTDAISGAAGRAGRAVGVAAGAVNMDDPAASARRAVARSCPRPPRRTRRPPTSSTRSATTSCPTVTAGTGLDVLVTGSVARHRRLLRLPRRPPAAVLRRRARPVVPAADGRVPLAAGAAQGRRS